LGENTKKNGGNFLTEAFTGLPQAFEAASNKIERRESLDVGYNNPDLYLQQNIINQYDTNPRYEMLKA